MTIRYTTTNTSNGCLEDFHNDVGTELIRREFPVLIQTDCCNYSSVLARNIRSPVFGDLTQTHKSWHIVNIDLIMEFFAPHDAEISSGGTNWPSARDSRITFRSGHRRVNGHWTETSALWRHLAAEALLGNSPETLVIVRRTVYGSLTVASKTRFSVTSQSLIEMPGKHVFYVDWTEDAVWRNRFPLNNIYACWFLPLVHRLYLS